MEGNSIKRNMIIGLIAIAVVIIVIVAGAAFMLGSNNNGNNEGTGMAQVSIWEGEYHIGDFVEYYYNKSSDSGNGYGILNNTITNISAPWITIHETRMPDPVPGNNGSSDWDTPINASFAFNKGPNFNYDPASIKLFKLVGNETLSTKWGPLPCQHFDLINTEGGTYDCWVFNGVVIKLVESAIIFSNPPTSETWTLELKNTNLEEFMSS